MLLSQSRVRPFGTVSLCVAMLGFLATQTQAQVARLDPKDYGKVALHDRQSLGGAVEAVQASRTIFEPIAALRSDDPLAIASRAVVRIDLLVEEDGREALLVCTGTLISPIYILTNSHCISVNGRKLIKTSAVFDHTRTTGEGAKRVDLAPRPVEDDPELDYAILQLEGAAPDGITPLKLSALPVAERQRLRVVHHPLGRPKMMTQFGCQVSQTQDVAQAVTVRHLCDTQNGSSGALLLDPSSLEGVAVHHSGGLAAGDPESFNVATSIIAIARRSPIVRQLLKGAILYLLKPKAPDQQSSEPADDKTEPSAIEAPRATNANKNGRTDLDRINEMMNAQ